MCQPDEDDCIYGWLLAVLRGRLSLALFVLACSLKCATACAYLSNWKAYPVSVRCHIIKALTQHCLCKNLLTTHWLILLWTCLHSWCLLNCLKVCRNVQCHEQCGVANCPLCICCVAHVMYISAFIAYMITPHMLLCWISDINLTLVWQLLHSLTKHFFENSPGNKKSWICHLWQAALKPACYFVGLTYVPAVLDSGCSTQHWLFTFLQVLTACHLLCSTDQHFRQTAVQQRGQCTFFMLVK